MNIAHHLVTADKAGNPKVMAVASGGGHWEQLMLIASAFDNCTVTYVTTGAGFAERDGIKNAVLLPDANRSSPMTALRTLVASWHLVRKMRPDLVISTGALPGLCCLFIGRLYGARTMWIDSLANFEKLSMSGKWAQRIADVCLTQWEHQARPGGPEYSGTLL